MSSRAELLSLLQELRELLALEDGGRHSFRVRAFEKASEVIRSSEQELGKLSVAKLAALPGLGKSTAECIREFYSSGRIARLDSLRSTYPEDFVRLTQIPGLGAKTAIRLRDELQIGSVSDLRRAITRQELRRLPGLGAATEAKLSKALERIGSKQNRRPIHKVLFLAELMVTEIESLPEVERAQYGGSLRRFEETIADIDLVVVSDQREAVLDFFLNMPRVAEVLSHGESMASVFLETGIQVDLRVTNAEESGAALLYFTGGKAHNIRLRQHAHDLGMALNEHSLHDRESGEVVASRTEESIYQALGLAWIEPTLRQDLGEFEAAQSGLLPDLLKTTDLKGDLHVHCDFSGDAKSSVEEMIETAAELGYAYFAISDHAENLRLNGVTADQHRELSKRIQATRLRFPDMLILHGCELNIGRDGSLDYSEEDRQIFDICLASVHSHFDLPEKEQTARLIRAMEEPCVRILGHMLGRSIGRRPGIDIRVDEVLHAALENDVAIEVNSGLSRLDPPPAIIRRGCELGNLFVVNSDAHHKDHLRGIEYGVRHSQRGWLPRDRVVNTWTRDRFQAWLAEPFS